MRRALLILCVISLAPMGQALGLSIGLQDDVLSHLAPERVDSRVALIAASGARWTRIDVLWREVAPTRPQSGANHNDPAYRWEHYDAALDALNAVEISVILTPSMTPRWASTRGRVNDIPRARDYADFARAITRRYGNRIGAIEAWNEPNYEWFLTPQYTPNGRSLPATTAYIGMLRSMRAGLTAAKSRALLLGVSGAATARTIRPSPSDRDGESVGIVEFITRLGKARAPMDAISQHIYPIGAPARSTALLSFRGMAKYTRYADRIRRGIPIWITEFGYTTRPTAVRPAHTSEAAQARNIAPALSILSRNRRIPVAIWYQLQDNADWTAGLMRPDGSFKPAWGAFRTQAQRYR